MVEYTIKGTYLITVNGDNAREAIAKTRKLFEYAGIDRHTVETVRATREA